MNDEQSYPDWIYKKIIEDNLPWDKQADLTLDAFNEKYTLHDSYWVGIFHHVAFNQSITLAFQWDSVWLPNDIKEGTSLVADWPYLFIQLEKVQEINTSNFGGLEEISRAIGELKLLEINGTFYLAIDDVYGGQVDIVFTGHHKVLALNPDANLLTI